MNACTFKSLELCLCGSDIAAYYRTGVSETFSRRRISADYKRNDGLGAVCLYPRCRILLAAAADLAEQDDDLRFGICVKQLNRICLREAPERASADGNDGGLSDTGVA